MDDAELDTAVGMKSPGPPVPRRVRLLWWLREWWPLFLLLGTVALWALVIVSVLAAQ